MRPADVVPAHRVRLVRGYLPYLRTVYRLAVEFTVRSRVQTFSYAITMITNIADSFLYRSEIYY